MQLLINPKHWLAEVILNLTNDRFDDMIKDYSMAAQDLLDVFIAKTQKLWLHIPFIFERSSYKTKLKRSTEITAGILTQVK